MMLSADVVSYQPMLLSDVDICCCYHLITSPDYSLLTLDTVILCCLLKVSRHLSASLAFI
jgi:hypothetical protein